MSCLAAPRFQSANTQYAQLPPNKVAPNKVAPGPVSVNVQIQEAHRYLMPSSVDLSHKRLAGVKQPSEATMDSPNVSINVDSTDSTPRGSVQSCSDSTFSNDCLNVPEDLRVRAAESIPEAEGEESPCEKKHVRWNKYNRIYDTFSTEEYCRKTVDRRYTEKEMTHIREELDELHTELLGPNAPRDIIGAPSLLREEDLGDKVKSVVHNVEHQLEHALHSVAHLLDHVHLPKGSLHALISPVHTPQRSPKMPRASHSHDRSSLCGQYSAIRHHREQNAKHEEHTLWMLRGRVTPGPLIHP